MFGKKKKRLEISAPSNFEHRVHTGFDPREQKFTGLPQQWQSLLADTANRPKPMVDPSYITPIQLAPMKVDGGQRASGRTTGTHQFSVSPRFTLSSRFLCLYVYMCVSPPSCPRHNHFCVSVSPLPSPPVVFPQRLNTSFSLPLQTILISL